MAVLERIKIVQKISEEEFWAESNAQKINAVDEKKERRRSTNMSMDDYNLNDLMNISFDMNMFLSNTNEKSSKYINDLYVQDLDDILFTIASSIIVVGIGIHTTNNNNNNNTNTKIPLSASQTPFDMINELLPHEDNNNRNNNDDDNDDCDDNNNKNVIDEFLQLAPEIIDLAYSIYANRNEKLQKIFKIAERGLYKELNWNLTKTPNFINIQMEPINVTLLHVCCQFGHLKSIYMLLEKGADANIEDEFGFTSIMYALIKYAYYCNELNKYKVNINNDNDINDNDINDYNGKQSDLYFSIIKLLINYNASLTLRNNKNLIQFKFKPDVTIQLLEQRVYLYN
jgi:hypothetical protein